MNTPLQDRINDYWTTRAPSYDAYQQRPERRELDRLAWGEIWSAVLPVAPCDVLDVGTGSGQVACLLAGLGYRVTGIDLSPGMVALARTHAAEVAQPPTVEIGDAVAPEFAVESFDALVSRYVLWTLRDPELAAANWLKLLRPGGLLAMVDSTWFTDGLGALYGDRPETALPLADAESIEASADVLRRAGFTEVQIEPLQSIYDLDAEHGVAPGHQVQMQYLITARAL